MVLRILPEYGGRTRDEGKYYADGPELVVEVSDSTLKKDLGPKLADYERAGVPEYVVLGVEPAGRPLACPEWRAAGRGRPGRRRALSIEGLPRPLARSRAAPGDTRALRSAVDRGVATAEHAEFLARLAEAGGGR